MWNNGAELKQGGIQTNSEGKSRVGQVKSRADRMTGSNSNCHLINTFGSYGPAAVQHVIRQNNGPKKWEDDPDPSAPSFLKQGLKPAWAVTCTKLHFWQVPFEQTEIFCQAR